MDFLIVKCVYNLTCLIKKVPKEKGRLYKHRLQTEQEIHNKANRKCSNPKGLQNNLRHERAFSITVPTPGLSFLVSLH